MPERLLLDCDTGIDDALAIAAQALIGKGMALSRGRADPEKLAALLEKALNG